MPESTLQRRPERPDTAPDNVRRLRAALGVLFPEPIAAGVPKPEPGRRHADAARSGRRRAVRIVIQLAAVGLGTVVLLLRVSGIPPWDTVYAEDQGVFLDHALTRPWHLLVPYGGYEELLPRLVGQLVSYLPLVDVAMAYALAGAGIAALCALFTFHAMEGWVRSPWLRALVGAALILLPLAPIEIADNTVNAPWYLLAVLPFGLLWRPKGWAGMTAVALVAFAATSSEILAIVCAPLVLLRLVALPRWREHAVTVGWLAGLLVQLPVIVDSYVQHTQRAGKLGTPGYAVWYYVHGVLLRAFGWRVSVHLSELAGFNSATVIVCAILAAGLGWALIIGTRQVRVFAATALIMGFAQTVLAASLAPNMMVSPDVLWAARYSTLPIMLIAASGVVAVDAYLRRQASAEGRSRIPFIRLTPQALAAVVVLTGVLAIGWVSDYRYDRNSTWGYWKPKAEQMLRACGHTTSGEIAVWAWPHRTIKVRCDRLRS